MMTRLMNAFLAMMLISSTTPFVIQTKTIGGSGVAVVEYNTDVTASFLNTQQIHRARLPSIFQNSLTTILKSTKSSDTETKVGNKRSYRTKGAPVNGEGDSQPRRSYTTNAGNRRSYTTGGGRNQNNRNGYRGGGGGGGYQRDNTPALKLSNPLKMRRIMPEWTPPQRGERAPRDNNDRRGGAGSDGGAPKPRSFGIGGGDGGGAGAGAPTKDAGRGRRQRGPKRGGGGNYGDRNSNAGRNAGRTSLRIGNSRGRNVGGRRRGSLRKRDRTAERLAKEDAAIERKTVTLPDGPMSVAQLAECIDEKPVAVIKFLMTDLGIMAGMTQSLDQATCIAIAEGFGKIVGGADEMDEELMEMMAEESALSTGFVEEEEDPDSLVVRPPVVTIMGHVDHGKTSLLDAIRNTDVTAGEHGGITQHIASYQVKHNGNTITFIDTPGHAAFTDMRERGANITDIVILVVAADDGVKQQTADSIMCARQSGVPMIVAINKCDLETADPVKTMTDLTAYDVLTEQFGGEVLSSQISAKTGDNLDDLLDKILLQAEVQDLKANPDRDAEGFVVEANVEKGLGTVATTLVKKGTLRVGDIFVAGDTYGKVRALISTADNSRYKEVGPSTPVRVVGFEGVPSAGDVLIVAKDEQTARELAENRQRIEREKQSAAYQSGLMSSVAMSFGSGKQHREMCVLVKADVQGTAEALTRSLRELKLENDEAVVNIKVLVSEAGEVSKSDIAIASVTPDTTVLAFNVAASVAAMDDARSLGIPIEYYSVVYDAIESVESRMQEVLSPTPDGEYVGSATVQEVFDIGGTGNIAGSRCDDGFIRKGANVRVMRGDKILTESKVKNLRSFKSEVDSIEEGNECGIALVDFETFEPGDKIECYVEK